MSTGPVAVIGANGQTGRAVLTALGERGLVSRAIVRAPERAEAAHAAGAAEHSLGDLRDVKGLTRALRGSAAVIVIPPVFRPDEDSLIANAVEAAVEAGVQRVILHSVLHSYTPGLHHHLRKARGEASLRASGAVWTVVAPAMYAQSIGFFLAGSDDPDVVAVPFDPSAPFTVVDVADVAAVHAIVLAEPGHEFATYEVSGAQIMNMHDMAAELGQVLGCQLVAEEVSPAEMRLPQGFDADAHADAFAMFAHYGRSGLVGNPRTARALLGREPASFAETMGRMFSAQNAKRPGPVRS